MSRTDEFAIEPLQTAAQQFFKQTLFSSNEKRGLDESLVFIKAASLPDSQKISDLYQTLNFTLDLPALIKEVGDAWPVYFNRPFDKGNDPLFIIINANILKSFQITELLFFSERSDGKNKEAAIRDYGKRFCACIHELPIEPMYKAIFYARALIPPVLGIPFEEWDPLFVFASSAKGAMEKELKNGLKTLGEQDHFSRVLYYAVCFILKKPKDSVAISAADVIRSSAQRLEVFGNFSTKIKEIKDIEIFFEFLGETKAGYANSGHNVDLELGKMMMYWIFLGRSISFYGHENFRETLITYLLEYPVRSQPDAIYLAWLLSRAMRLQTLNGDPLSELLPTEPKDFLFKNRQFKAKLLVLAKRNGYAASICLIANGDWGASKLMLPIGLKPDSTFKSCHVAEELTQLIETEGEYYLEHGKLIYHYLQGLEKKIIKNQSDISSIDPKIASGAMETLRQVNADIEHLATYLQYDPNTRSMIPFHKKAFVDYVAQKNERDKELAINRKRVRELGLLLCPDSGLGSALIHRPVSSKEGFRKNEKEKLLERLYSTRWDSDNPFTIFIYPMLSQLFYFVHNGTNTNPKLEVTKSRLYTCLVSPEAEIEDILDQMKDGIPPIYLDESDKAAMPVLSTNVAAWMSYFKRGNLNLLSCLDNGLISIETIPTIANYTRRTHQLFQEVKYEYKEQLMNELIAQMTSSLEEATKDIIFDVANALILARALIEPIPTEDGVDGLSLFLWSAPGCLKPTLDPTHKAKLLALLNQFADRNSIAALFYGAIEAGDRAAIDAIRSLVPRTAILQQTVTLETGATLSQC